MRSNVVRSLEKNLKNDQIKAIEEMKKLQIVGKKKKNEKEHVP
jgi:hypothetical protein